LQSLCEVEGSSQTGDCSDFGTLELKWMRFLVFSDDIGSKSGGEKRTEYRDDDEEFTLERTCTKMTEKITANRKSRSTRHENKHDADQRVCDSAHQLVS